jgi:hypothetical protein
MGRTWWLMSASMMMMNSPRANCRPWMYAVPSPSLPARGFSTTLSSPYACQSPHNTCWHRN